MTKRCDKIAARLAVGSLGSGVGVYVVFPVWLWFRCHRWPRPLRLTGERPASISVVIAAHNEADFIAQKLDDLVEQRFGGPAPEVQVVVASDGSTDETVPIALRHPSAPVVLDLPRGGKAAALNAALKIAAGEVIVFTDANSRLGSDALAELIAPFADPDVGGVAGDQQYFRGSSGAATGERNYWSLERMLKRWESCAGSVVSSTGALHAVLRECIDEVPADVTDDFFLSVGVVIRGRRLVYAPAAVAWEEPNLRSSAEYRRRVRIITRGLTAVRRRSALLDPRRFGAQAVIVAVHKVARRLMFVPMVVGATCSFVARDRSRWWRLTWVAQSSFYVLAAVGLVVQGGRIGRHPITALPAHFCVANVAAAHATLNVARSKRLAVWQPERGSVPQTT